jgi:myo-inositol-1(or 4)-monophosphatase
MAHSMSKEELKEVYDFALRLGRDAGEILIEGVEKRTGEQSGREDVGEMAEKMNAVDIVTQTDLGIFPLFSNFTFSPPKPCQVGCKG